MNELTNRIACGLALVCSLLSVACQLSAVSENETLQAQTSPDQQENALIIENESELPSTYPGARYEVAFHSRRGVPQLHWRVEKGALPPGITLEENGLLHGSPQRTGEFQFTVSVRDSGKPQQSVQKDFLIRVTSAMTLEWRKAASVNSNRIEGSVEVSNTTPDDIDLTFIVLAVAPNGRATAIGYQHFTLIRGSSKELPFGDTLPPGSYVVHVDAVGEVPSRNMIYRTRLQTSALQVVVGP